MNLSRLPDDLHHIRGGYGWFGQFSASMYKAHIFEGVVRPTEIVFKHYIAYMTTFKCTYSLRNDLAEALELCEFIYVKFKYPWVLKYKKRVKNTTLESRKQYRYFLNRVHDKTERSYTKAVAQGFRKVYKLPTPFGIDYSSEYYDDMDDNLTW